MIRIVGQASRFPVRPKPVASGSTISGRVLTLRRAEDGTSLSGASVIVDGTVTRTSDSGGRVEFPASLLPPGGHRLTITSADGRHLELTVTVGADGNFAQTVRLARAGAGADSGTSSAAAGMTLAGALPGGSVGTKVAGVFVATGGTEPYTYDVSAGALPGGVTLNGDTGIVTGTYAAEGTFDFTVHAIDAASNEATLDVEVVVTPEGGSWVDITSDTYWTASGHHWTGSEWVMDSAPACASGSGLNPTSAGIAAMAPATKMRVSLRSHDALDGSSPNFFPTTDNAWGTTPTLEKNTITSSADAASTVYTDLEDDTFVPLTSTGDQLSASSRCGGNYPTDNYDFLKIEVLIP